jgi:hypothetical protein
MHVGARPDNMGLELGVSSEVMVVEDEAMGQGSSATKVL